MAPYEGEVAPKVQLEGAAPTKGSEAAPEVASGEASDGATPEVAGEDTDDEAAEEEPGDAVTAGEAGDAEAPDGVGEGDVGARDAARPRREERRSPEAVQELSGAIHLTVSPKGR